MNSVHIPLAFIPESARDHYERYECRYSIATVEAILAQEESGAVTISTGDLCAVLGTNVYKHQRCIAAWAVFGTSNLVELLNSVRNRVLDFALAVWKEAPQAGEAEGQANITLEPARVTQIFNTTIYGGSANLVGTANSSTIAFNVGAGDFPSLERVLRENGVSEVDLISLQEALELETELTRNEGFGPKVSDWVGKMTAKAAEGGWKISLAAAGNLLASAIRNYYGLP